MSINWRTVAVAALAAALAGTATTVVTARAQGTSQSAAGIIVAAPATSANKPYAYIVTADGDVFQVEDNNSVQFKGNLQAVKAKATK
jgi:long-subunit fatty acid transport protein